MSQADVPTPAESQSCRAASQMRFARISRKHKCQRAWYGCQNIGVTEHPVLLQPDTGHDGFFFHRLHHHHMRSGRPTATQGDLLLAAAVNVLPS